MAIWMPSKLMKLDPLLPSSDLLSSAGMIARRKEWGRKKKIWTGLIAANSTPLDTHQEADEGVGIMCEPCSGQGWLLCDFCKGQKTNVKAANNRIYRRCPECKAVGYVLCPKCKVFKCVSYPDFNDGEL